MDDTEKTAGEKILRGVAAGAEIRKGVHLLSAQGHVLVVELPHSVLHGRLRARWRADPGLAQGIAEYNGQAHRNRLLLPWARWL